VIVGSDSSRISSRNNIDRGEYSCVRHTASTVKDDLDEVEINPHDEDSLFALLAIRDDDIACRSSLNQTPWLGRKWCW